LPDEFEFHQSSEPKHIRDELLYSANEDEDEEEEENVTLSQTKNLNFQTISAISTLTNSVSIADFIKRLE